MIVNIFIISNLIISASSILLILFLATKPIKLNLYNRRLYSLSLIGISLSALLISSILIYGKDILIDIALWMFALTALIIITIIPIKTVYIGFITFLAVTTTLLILNQNSLGEDFAIATLLLILVLLIKHILYEKIRF